MVGAACLVMEASSHGGTPEHPALPGAFREGKVSFPVPDLPFPGGSRVRSRGEVTLGQWIRRTLFIIND